MLEVANRIATSTLAKVEVITLAQINVKAFRLYTSNPARRWNQKTDGISLAKLLCLSQA
jgi:hypothetical protein